MLKSEFKDKQWTIMEVCIISYGRNLKKIPFNHQYKIVNMIVDVSIRTLNLSTRKDFQIILNIIIDFIIKRRRYAVYVWWLVHWFLRWKVCKPIEGFKLAYHNIIVVSILIINFCYERINYSQEFDLNKVYEEYRYFK